MSGLSDICVLFWPGLVAVEGFDIPGPELPAVRHQLNPEPLGPHRDGHPVDQRQLGIDITHSFFAARGPEHSSQNANHCSSARDYGN